MTDAPSPASSSSAPSVRSIAARVVAGHQAHLLGGIGLLRGRRVLERAARSADRALAGVGGAPGRHAGPAHAARKPQRPHHAAQHVGRLVAQLGLLRRQEQSERPALDDVEPPLARGQLAQVCARVARHHQRPAVGIEQHLRELGVVARRGDLHQTARQDRLDVDAVPEARSLRPHRLQRGHEHVPGQLLDQPLDDAPGLLDVLVGARAQPRVHVRDGLVVAVRRQGSERQLLLEHRAGDRIDVLADQGSQQRQRLLGATLHPRLARAGDVPQIARVAGRQGGAQGQLAVGGGHVVLLQGHQRVEDVREGDQPVGGPAAQERLDLGADHRRRYPVRPSPRLAQPVEEGARGRRGRQRRHGRTAVRTATAGRERRPADQRDGGTGRDRGEAVATPHALACLARA